MFDPQIKKLLIEEEINQDSSWAIVRDGIVAGFSIVPNDQPSKTFYNNVLKIDTHRATLCINFDDSIQAIVGCKAASIYQSSRLTLMVAWIYPIQVEDLMAMLPKGSANHRQYVKDFYISSSCQNYLEIVLITLGIHVVVGINYIGQPTSNITKINR